MKKLFFAFLALFVVSVFAIGFGPIQGSGFIPAEAPATSAFGEASVSELTPQVGLRFNYGVNERLYTDLSANSGTFTIANGLASVQSGTNAAGLGAMHSVDVLTYIPGLGATARFTAGFTACVADSTQYAGVIDASDGFAFGCNGASFGLLRLKDGTPNWIAQTSWNVDKMDGNGPSGMTIDITKLNVYQIQYQWLGAGQINYFLEDEATGKLDLVHEIKYANQNTTPTVSNPTLPLALHSENTGNTTNLTIISASMGGFVEGKNTGEGIIFASGVEDVSYLAAGGEVPIFTIRNRASYYSKTNRVVVAPLDAGISSDGTKGVTFKAYLNTALTGASYADVNTTESVMEVDTAATAITGGYFVGFKPLAKNESKDIDMTNWDLELHPGDSLTVTAESASNSTVSAGIIWKEKH